MSVVLFKVVEHLSELPLAIRTFNVQLGPLLNAFKAEAMIADVRCAEILDVAQTYDARIVRYVVK